MKYQSTKTLFTILLFLLIVTEGHGATQHQPSNMQTRKIDIYTSSVTNINAGLYSFPYENALTLSSSRGYNPIGMVKIILYLDKHVKTRFNSILKRRILVLFTINIHNINHNFLHDQIINLN